MANRPIRRFTWQFKVQLCSDIRGGVISRSRPSASTASPAS